MSDAIIPIDNPFGELVGFHLRKMSEGIGVCDLELGAQHGNPNKVAHGGVLYSLVDTAMGAALYSRLSKEQAGATVEISIRYHRPAREGRAVCTAELVHLGKRIGSLRAEVRVGEELLASAAGTFAIFAAPVKRT